MEKLSKPKVDIDDIIYAEVFSAPCLNQILHGDGSVIPLLARDIAGSLKRSINDEQVDLKGSRYRGFLLTQNPGTNEMLEYAIALKIHELIYIRRRQLLSM